MRIYLSGDENAARWHLPVAQVKVQEFARETQKAGLKQNRFTFLFKETGAIVHAQYVFGQVSMQIHAPFIPMVEEVAEEVEEPITGPKTFWVNTTQGYFWVEVRYVEGVPKVILTPFIATKSTEDGLSTEFIYPVMDKQTPGMLAVSQGAIRVVLTQAAGVFFGSGVEHGMVKLPPSSDGSGRITPNFLANDYLVISGDAESRTIKKISVVFTENYGVTVDLKSVEVSSLLAVGDGSLPVGVLQPNPIWIHRKCNASYFSPNKTIGYHVDIGADEEFMGNMSMAHGLDLLDNTGGFSESLFNHTPDMFRIISLMNFPVAVAGDIVTIILESPTMLFDNADAPRCWGGYAMASWEFGCADYQRDFSSWYLSPRPITVVCNLNTGIVEMHDVSDIGNGEVSGSTETKVYSWDGLSSALMQILVEHKCDTVEYEKYFPDGTLVGNCDWVETCSGTCQYDDPTSYSGDCAKIWDVYKHRSVFIREDLQVKRQVFLVFGGNPEPRSPQGMVGFFLMFDGLWHLDVGLHWAHQMVRGDYCQLCSIPMAGQEPGELIYFFVGGSSSIEQINATGHEFVENLEVVTPLGYYTGPYGFEVFGFVARVPEEYAAPHEPVVVTGGIEYISGMDSDAKVRCQKSLMSRPCDCATQYLGWLSAETPLPITGGVLAVDGGCGPYNWAVTGGSLVDEITNDNYGSSEYATTKQSFLIEAEDVPCGMEVKVWDACGRTILKESEISVGVISGPDIMAPGSTATFTFDINTTSVLYVGTLELVSQSGTSVVLKMPDDACGGEYVVTLQACGYSGTKLVRPTAGSWVLVGWHAWYSNYGEGIRDQVWSLFPSVPGYCTSTFEVFSMEAYYGKYKCLQSTLVWRTATPESCESNGAPMCCSNVAGSYYIGVTTDGVYFHTHYSGEESRGACANGESVRHLYEWKC